MLCISLCVQLSYDMIISHQTLLDEHLFNSGDVVSNDGKRLRYFPSDSLPALFYPRPDPDQPGDLAEFIKPAVMMQVCTQWDCCISFINH